MNMYIKFSAVITPDSLSFVAPDGVSYSYQQSMSDDVFRKACGYIRDIQKLNEPDPLWPLDRQWEEQSVLIDKLIGLLTPTKIIQKHGEGRVEVHNGGVYFDGKLIHNAITENILWGISEGFNVKPYMRFMEKLQENPSKRAVNELFGFIQRYKLVIDEDGDILAYKKVQENWFDLHTGTINNFIGLVVKIPRNMVDDDFGLLCSEGLHCCAFDYLQSYSSAHNNRVILIKIHPKDVVSIPTDDAAKMRICEYLVLREIPYNHGDDEHVTVDHLAEKPVWTNDDIHHHSGVEVGDAVKFIGLKTKYNLLNADQEYIVSKVQDWGGITYISVEDFPDNTIFLLSEFEVQNFLAAEIPDENDEEIYDDDDFDADNWDISWNTNSR